MTAIIYHFQTMQAKKLYTRTMRDVRPDKLVPWEAATDRARAIWIKTVEGEFKLRRSRQRIEALKCITS